MALVQQNVSNSITHNRNFSVFNISKFRPFDPNFELWKDNWAGFTTFTNAHSVPDNKKICFSD